MYKRANVRTDSSVGLYSNAAVGAGRGSEEQTRNDSH